MKILVLSLLALGCQVLALGLLHVPAELVAQAPGGNGLWVAMCGLLALAGFGAFVLAVKG